MRKWFIGCFILMVIGISFHVQAQTNLTLKKVSVEIWPEYDQPAVLVIYHISLPTSATLPTVLDLRVPVQAEVFAVAVSDPTSGLINAPYDRVVQGSWATLKINTNSPEVQVEYYDTLEKNGTSRHVVYEWAGDYAVDSFSVAFQQPVNATELVTDPILALSNVGQDGFNYYQSPPQNLAIGQTFTLTADYQKATDELSTTGLPVQPTQPLNTSTPGRVSMSSILPWLLAGIGGVLIIAGIIAGIYMWKSGMRHLPGSRKRHAPSLKAGEPSEVYCYQCGKRTQPGDVFCRTCGVRIKKDA
jgi:hypothetical protein